jgi:hypothetical protein
MTNLFIAMGMGDIGQAGVHGNIFETLFGLSEEDQQASHQAVSSAFGRVRGRAHGGIVKGYALGGLVDNTLIAATPGEMVVNRASTQANRGLLEDINNSNGRAVGGGNMITINVQGGMLGDRNEARRFARAIDQELMELRQGGESRAFDGDLF